MIRKPILFACLSFLISLSFYGCKKEKKEIKTESAASFKSADQEADQGQGLTAEKAEKEKAMKNLYPNDLGPDKVDVSNYPPGLQEGYRLLVGKCSACHSAARPLNSEFVDLDPEAIESLKKTNPEIFKNELVWKVEHRIWQRYVKRMMAKPGCNISGMEGRKIFQFIREYSKRQKTGSQTAQWASYRKKLLADFRSKYPERYQELFVKE